MSPLAEAIRAHAFPLDGPQAFNPLLGRIAETPLVLLGNATHGSQQLFQKRIDLTQRLITEKQVNLLALEADWPSVARLNRFILGQGDDPTPASALESFRQFPDWLWRNRQFAQFVDWLRQHNRQVRPQAGQVELVGLDLFNRQASMNRLMERLRLQDPEAARWAEVRFASLDYAIEVPHPYEPRLLDLPRSRINEIVTELVQQQEQTREQLRRVPSDSMAAAFYVEQSRRVVRSAELFYRSLFEERTSSANLHQEHMLGTISALFEYHRQHQRPLKMVVWSHNVHAGDSRATQLGAAGEWNMGELVRELYGDKVSLIGLTTFAGSLSATTSWGAPLRRMNLRPALLGSYEALFHESGHPQLMVCFGSDDDLTDALYQPRLERAIGAVYLPATERLSHYYQARLSSQFNAVLHIDQTTALEPLEHTTEWDLGDLAEPYPHAA